MAGFEINPFTGVLDKVGSGGGGGDTGIFLLLAGRAGDANDPVISSDDTGTIYGSGVTGEGLTLKPNDADDTGKLGLFDPDAAFVHMNAFGRPALIFGAVDPTADLAGGSSVARFGIFDNDLAIFAIRSDEGNQGPPRLMQIFFGDSEAAPVFGVIRGRGGSFAGREQPQDRDGLFAFSVQSYKDDGSEMDDFAGAFGFEVDGVFSDYVAARLGFSIMFNDGTRQHPVYFFPNDLITLGADLRDVDGPVFDPVPSDRTVNIQSWRDKITLVVRATAGQAEDLTQWWDDNDDPQTLVDFAGILKLAEVNNPTVAVASPQAGMIVLDTNTNKFTGYDGTNWVALH